MSKVTEGAGQTAPRLNPRREAAWRLAGACEPIEQLIRELADWKIDCPYCEGAGGFYPDEYIPYQKAEPCGLCGGEGRIELTTFFDVGLSKAKPEPDSPAGVARTVVLDRLHELVKKVPEPRHVTVGLALALAYPGLIDHADEGALLELGRELDMDEDDMRAAIRFTHLFMMFSHGPYEKQAWPEEEKLPF